MNLFIRWRKSLMKPNNTFLKLPKSFWASVRLISQEVGYTEKGKIRIPNENEIRNRLNVLDVDVDRLFSQKSDSGCFGKLLQNYFTYRADVLNNYAKPRLMDVTRAKEVFDTQLNSYKPSYAVPLNKQKGVMKTPAYLTGLVNMIIEENLYGRPCDYDPRHLTSIMKDNLPLRTLARRVDGAFPSSINPIAVWEIKEYYYTTTFGSRIADGIYESLLDGLELEELREHENVDIKHYLIIDAYNTWWNMGKSYLCRIVDILHMGYLDEVLFGYEVVEKLPQIVNEWVKLFDDANG
jgi:hypothetical protein